MIKIIKIDQNAETRQINRIHYHIYESGERMYGRLNLPIPVDYNEQNEAEIINIVEQLVDVEAEKKRLLKRSQLLSKQFPVNMVESGENDTSYEVNIPDQIQIEKEQLEQWRSTAEVEMWKLRAELSERPFSTSDKDYDNMLQAVNEAVPTLSEKATIAWEYATYTTRMSVAVMAVGQILGQTAEQLDNIIKSAQNQKL